MSKGQKTITTAVVGSIAAIIVIGAAANIASSLTGSANTGTAESELDQLYSKVQLVCSGTQREGSVNIQLPEGFKIEWGGNELRLKKNGNLKKSRTASSCNNAIEPGDVRISGSLTITENTGSGGKTLSLQISR